MRIATGVLAVLLGFSAGTPAQTPATSRGQGYLFVAPLVTSRYESVYTQIAGGGEGFLYKGIGLGVEIGPVFRWSNFSDYVYALGSANVSYHFLPRTIEQRVEPFVTAGYSMFARAGIRNGSNVGGGINIWLTRKFAFRFEVRGYGGHNLRTRTSGPRIGLTFR